MARYKVRFILEYEVDADSEYMARLQPVVTAYTIKPPYDYEEIIEAVEIKGEE